MDKLLVELLTDEYMPVAIGLYNDLAACLGDDLLEDMHDAMIWMVQSIQRDPVLFAVFGKFIHLEAR